jgi:acetoin utilization protein AcuB
MTTLKLRDILRPAPVIAPHETATTAWDRMHDLGVDHLVVVRGDEIAGVLSRHDLGGPLGGGHRRMGRHVADLMKADVVVASPGTDVKSAAGLMRRHGIGCLPVADDGKLVGLVTVADLLALLEQTLAQ